MMVQVSLNERELEYIIGLIEYDDGIHPIDTDNMDLLNHLKSQLDGYKKLTHK